MIEKQTLLEQVKYALTVGIVTDTDIRSLLPPTSAATPLHPTLKAPQQPNKLSAIEVMFYAAGIVLFASIMSMIVQSWSSGSAFIHVLLSAGVGACFWSLAYYLHKQATTTELRKGLENAIILTGSLCIIVGGFILTNEIIGGFQEVNYIPGAFTFALLSALHLFYDKLVRKNFTILMGLLLGVAAFPALLFGILEDSHLPFDVWALVAIAAMSLLIYTSRVIAKVYPERHSLDRAFDSPATFVALAVMFSASFGDYSLFWLALLIASVFGAFYASIIAQNKHLLGSASFFLVVAVLMVSFKYFSGAGITVSLIVATMGLLASAAIATSINKKYFKKTSELPPAI